ncbi:MAG: glycosyltransferase family 1 protein [Niallia nealsonii]|nr:glycosyltransferase family 1 protein [Niallia nealsonii]
MQIYINGRFLAQSITGVQRYALELIKAIDLLITEKKIDGEITILAPKNYILNPPLNNIKIKKVGIFKGHLWEQVELPFYSKGGVLFNPCGPAPLLKKEQVVTIHDGAVFANSQAFTKLFSAWYKIMFKTLGKQSREILTVSDFSKSELVKYLKVSPDKFTVTYLGKEHITRLNSDYNIIKENNLDKEKYVLAVSSLSPNKNFKGIVKAIELMDLDLNVKIVIAGGSHPSVFSDKLQITSDKIIHVGYVTDNELKALYENALCFVYPSFYEGFGLPPLEAMALKCPVIVSNRASLPEIGQNSVLYCNPNDPNDIASKIKMIVESEDLREEFANKGLERSKNFSWRKCAIETIKVINRFE